jgi:hypothetical protein
MSAIMCMPTSSIVSGGLRRVVLLWGAIYGALYALFSTLSPFALVFIPLAVLTTLHLRSRLLRSSQPAQS